MAGRYSREIGLIRMAQVLWLAVELVLVAGMAYSIAIDDSVAREYVGKDYPEYFLLAVVILVLHWYSMQSARTQLEDES